MHEERRHLPTKPELFTALDALVDLQLERPEWIEENDLARVANLLTLERVGGPQMPESHERAERLKAVRELLLEIAPRFLKLSQEELEDADLVYPATKPKGGERFAHEPKRLHLAARTLFQLQLEKPDREISRKDIRSAGNKIWGKEPHPDSRWFEREREKFVLDKLAEWIIETEEAHREANSQPGDDAESPPPATETTSPPADTPDVRDGPDSLGPTGGEADNEVEPDESDDDVFDLAAEAAELPPPVGPRRLRIRWVVVLAFATALAAALAAVVLEGSEAPANAAGEVSRVLDVPAPEDMAVAGGFVWLVNANDETAIRVSERTGKQETIFVDQPPFVSEPLPGSHTHTGARLGGYRVAAGADRAWIVTNGGVVLSIDTTGQKVRTLNPDLKVLAGEPALYHDSLWVGGFGEYLFRLRADTGAVQREYALRGHPFSIDKLATGVGSIWAYTDFGDDPRIYKLTPVAGRPGVEEHILPLDHPVHDLAAGLGGVWTVNSGGAVTWHDPATGGSARPIQVPGGAEEIALSQDAVWVTTGSNTVVRIDPITLAVVGEPIPLPGAPTGIAADERAWVATAKTLVEIAS
jgi:hypothetical protein